MLVDKKLLNKTRELGLNTYEAKIWIALLSRGVSTAGEISDIANVPRSRSYDVLESLEKKGFIVMKVGKPIQYIAVHPEEVLERVKKNVLQEAESTVEILREFEESDLLKELRLLHKEGIDSVDPTEIAGYVKGRKNVNEQMKNMLKTAKSSVLIVTTESGSSEVENNLSRDVKKALKNNVQVMVSSPKNIDLTGVEVKNTGLQGRFMIADSQKVLFSITSDDTHPTYDTAIWTDSEFLALTFEQTFHNAWKGTNVKAALKTAVTKKN